ncbi:hypothetical protein ETU10_07810 [Apibacter muscae]|uniref:hypothetical protein n=1 Tax=Apibacter muscae TaxID=2509004 RepID=UPI0011AD0B87|nr:hypothetical protein [Apibacter muscae]TWP23249.1 hypothetical protein ETU10_07810 [Apibacter muscae]
MRKILNVFLFILFLLIIAGCILPYFLPKNIEISASKKLTNPISEVFLEFNDLENFGSWGLLTEQDSINTRINYFSPYKGKGASLTWKNKKNYEIGNGEFKILESIINKKIKAQIIFVNYGILCSEDIYFKSLKEGTYIKVSLKTQDFSYFKRIFAYLNAENLQEILDESLNRLELKLNKKNIPQQLKLGESDFIDKKNVQLLVVKNETTTDSEEISKNLHKSFHTVNQYMVDSLNYSLLDIKNPIVYYTNFDTINKSATYYAGYPVNNLDIIPNDNIKLISIPSGKAIFTPIKTTNLNLLNSKYTLDSYAKENGIKLKNQFWQEFNDFPTSNDDEIRGNAFYLIIE